VRRSSAGGGNDETMTLGATCTVPQCGREFSFVADDTQIFEVPVSLFERRHFYRSELLLST